MKLSIPFTLELKEGGNKVGNVWESKEENARLPGGTVPRLRPFLFPQNTEKSVKPNIQGYKQTL